MKYFIPNEIAIRREPRTNAIIFGNSPINFQTLRTPPDYFEDLVILLDGSRDKSEVWRDLKKTKSEVNKEEFEDIITWLLEREILVIGYPFKEDYFNRQLRFFYIHTKSLDIAREMQQRIHDAHIVILGAGAIGSEVASGMAMAGVNKVSIVDFDTITDSNINRTTAFGVPHLGMKKTERIEEHITSNYPWCSVHTVDSRLSNRDQIATILKTMDDITIVVSCVNFPTWIIYEIAAVCVDMKLPMIKGGYGENYAAIDPIYIPNKTVCLMCMKVDSESGKPKQTQDNILEQRYIAPSVPWISKIVSNLIVKEVISFITGQFPLTTMNQRVEVDFLNLTTSRHRIILPKKCPVCGGAESRSQNS